ncbi:MAG TPA: hypothetical protein VNJ53_07455 [Gaiellaceae bacterium]|nr:hypothetical protein [Gaiellaceae bacterium]
MRTGAVLVALLAAALAAPATAASPVKTTLVTSTRTPVVGQAWRWTVTARTAGGAPLAARMKLQILLGETVVGCFAGGEVRQCTGASPGDWIAFRGRRTGVLRWPAESVGVTLTFQALVKVGKLTRKLRAPVTVRPA